MNGSSCGKHCYYWKLDENKVAKAALQGGGCCYECLKYLNKVKGLYQALSDSTQYWAINIDLINEWIAASSLLKHSLQSVQWVQYTFGQRAFCQLQN